MPHTLGRAGSFDAEGGAYYPADELRRARVNFQAASQGYENQIKPEIDQRQQQARKLASSFVPDCRVSMWMMYLFLKALFGRFPFGVPEADRFQEHRQMMDYEVRGNQVDAAALEARAVQLGTPPILTL